MMKEDKEQKRKFIIQEYVLPFFGMFAVLCVCIILHRLFIHRGVMIGPEEMIGTEMSSPTIGRLIFAVLSFMAFTVLTIISQIISKKGKIIPSFWLSMFAGTFLWQCLGEDMWHFSVDGVHFVQLESISVFPIVVLFLLFLFYSVRYEALGWGIQCTVLAFACNWIGHYVLLGIYPFVSPFVSQKIWCKSVGLSVGPVLFFLGIFLGISKTKNTKERLLAVILTYFSVAVFAFGMM